MQREEGQEESLAISFVSDASWYDSCKDKPQFIEVMCRYNDTNKDIKANNYQVNARKFNHGTSEDVLLWYTNVHEVAKQKPWDNVQAKFMLTSLSTHIFKI